jgi:osmotically-inducible protein OsmY
MPVSTVGIASLNFDRELKERISEQLAETNRPNLRRLAVVVNEGCVTIRGCVQSFYERQLAIRSCQSMAGVEQLIDAVEVAAH